MSVVGTFVVFAKIQETSNECTLQKAKKKLNLKQSIRIQSVRQIHSTMYGVH